MVERRLEQAAEVIERRLEQAAEVIERRLEQAAEEGGPGSEEMAGFVGWRIRLSCPYIVILALREWIIKPLDSGLRRNDEEQE